MEEINELIRLASEVAVREKSEKESDEREGRAFNVFRLCKVDHYENLHSYIIAGLLNPRGGHGQGGLFLDLFLGIIDSDFENQFESDKATVYTEYSMPLGRLDLLIEDNCGRAVIIENKIGAVDRNAQLKRYQSFAAGNRYENGYRILYLTLDGHEAEKHSGDGVVYECISYNYTILEWLKQCADAALYKPALREPLIQYMELIKQLVGQDMNKNVDQNLLKAMLDNPHGVAAIMRASDEWGKQIVTNHLFAPLKDYADKHGYDFIVGEGFWAKKKWVCFSFRIDSYRKIVFQFENVGWHQLYYGITDTSKNTKSDKPLHGLYGGNEGWPYGWRYMDTRNWTAEVLAEMAMSDKHVRSITDAVDNLISVMRTSGIIKP